MSRPGTTWTQELVWLVANNLDYKKAAGIPLTRRYTFIEYTFGRIKWTKSWHEKYSEFTKAEFLPLGGNSCIQTQFTPLSEPLEVALIYHFWLTDGSSFTIWLTDHVIYRIKFKMFLNEALREKIIKQSSGNEEIRKALEVLGTPGSEIVAQTPSPRFIKSHLPLSLLPPGMLDTTKVVYVARDPRDVAVSYYHHTKLFQLAPQDSEFKTFWSLFTRGMLAWAPFIDHIKEAWEMRNHPNMLFLFYEELIKDLPGTVRRVAKFFGKQYTDEQFEGLCSHLSFNNFKNNPSVNMDELKDLGLLSDKESFVRKGKSGGWREYFDEDMAREAERWISDNLRDTDLRFPSI